MEKRGQFAVEYMIIIAIALSIIVMGMYLLRGYVTESNDKVLGTRLSSISEDILLKARKMYYYGPPSKSSVSVDMPPQIKTMFVGNRTSPAGEEYVLGFTVFTTKGEVDMTFWSDVPLNVSESGACNSLPAICAADYNCRCFLPKYYSEGEKNLRIEAADKSSCAMSRNCIVIGALP